MNATRTMYKITNRRHYRMTFAEGQTPIFEQGLPKRGTPRAETGPNDCSWRTVTPYESELQAAWRGLDGWFCVNGGEGKK